MRNFIKKTSKILILIVATFFILSNIVFASPVDDFKEKINATGKGVTELENAGGEIVGIIQIIGTMVSVGILIILGIKYVMGSAEERASYKKSMFPYFIGAILIFGASNLAQIIYEWAKSI